MSRMKLKKKIKINYISSLTIEIILIVIFVSFLLKEFSIKCKSYLSDKIESEIVEITTIIINKSIKEELPKISDKNLIIINKNVNNEIIDISYNDLELNNTVYNISENILNSISNLEKGNIDNLNISYYDNTELMYYVPFGVIYDLPIIANISPKIPFKMFFLGSIDSFINTNAIEYGINNSLLETKINLTITIQVIFPFISKKIITNKEIPISTTMIQGKIPSYYGGIISNASPIITKSSTK